MSLLEKLKEEVITDPLLQKQYETEKEIYNIAKCLKKIRKEKKLTQKDIANKTGLSQQMVSKIESYNGNPSIESFVKYCFLCSSDRTFTIVSKDQKSFLTN